MTLKVENPAKYREQTAYLIRDDKGDFETFNYDQGPIEKSHYIGGAHLDYTYKGNELVDCNTLQYADGRPITDTPGAAIMVDNTNFSTYTPAGPATKTIYNDIVNIQGMLNTVAELPHK